MTWIATHNGVEIARGRWHEAELAVSRRVNTPPSPARVTLAARLVDAAPESAVSLTDGVHTYGIAPAETVAETATEPASPDGGRRELVAAFAEMLGGGLPVQPNPAPTEPTVQHADRGHSVLGASGSGRWMNCAASVRLSVGIPDSPGIAALTGTAAHEVAHMCLLSGQDAEAFTDRTVSGILVTAEMAAAVQVYLDDCRTCSALECHYEVQFDLAPLNPPVPMFGTADFVAYDRAARRLYVKDYKNGYAPVPAETPQLRYYALGAMLAIAPDAVDAELTICQPNGAGPALKRVIVTAEELRAWATDTLMPAARATQDPESPACAGAWCKYCPASPCATQATARLADARLDFAAIAAGPVAVPEVRAFTPADLGRVLHAAPLIREFLDAVESAVRRNPAETGWKVVETVGKVRPWRNAEEAAPALAMLYDIDPWAPREIVTPAEARRRIVAGTRDQHPTKKAAESAAKAAITGLLGPAKSGTDLVPDADPRPAVLKGAEFDKVTP